jgi:hypothetical protein
MSLTKYPCLAVLVLAVSSFSPIGRATTINFDDLPDLSDVGGFYHSTYGVDFQSSISLTAGFSLNEIDYPPHSGAGVIGDNVANDGDPLLINFVDPASLISGYFAYSSELTFTAYDHDGVFIGSSWSPNASNLESSLYIALSFSNVSLLEISGATANSFILDDLSFEKTPQTPGVPEGGSTFALLAVILPALALRRRQSSSRALDGNRPPQ